jgi:hypothetical protein
MCQTNYGLTPQYNWAINTFGGSNFDNTKQQKDFAMYSNIIFSNGELDPWRGGGVTQLANLNLPFFVIKGGAHHLDLRLPNEVDKGTDVEWVRE